MGIPALPFCHIQLHAQKPVSKAYPRELKTLGDHLRKKRLDLGLLQKEVAEIIGTTGCSIMYWETNRISPSIEFIPRIIDFLAYIPYGNIPEMSLGEKIVTCRRITGLTQKELAKRMEIDPATLARWERNESKPIKLYLKALNAFLDPIVSEV